jgi:hypothetical protein
MTNLTQYFTPGLQGTLALKAGSNFSYKGGHLQIYNNTEIDRWYVGSFSSANYFITVEFDSNQKETLQVLVVARPEHASFTVYGRTSVDDQLITISAEVTGSWLSLKASPADPAYAGARICLSATYAETMLPLEQPSAVGSFNPGGGGGSGGGSGPIGSTPIYSFSTVGVPGQTSISADVPEDQVTFIAGSGITLTTAPNANSLTIAASTTGFSSVGVAGQNTIQSDNLAGTLNFSATGGISVTTNSTTNTVTIAGSTAPLLSLSVTGESTLNSITASGAISTTSTLAVSGDTTLNNLIVNGNLEITGSTTVINSSSLEIADLTIIVAKNAASSLQANAAGIQISGAGAELVWNHSDSALNTNKSFLPTFGNNLNLGSENKLWSTIYAQNISGTLVESSQTNITSIGVLDSLVVAGNITSYADISTVGLTASGMIDIVSSRESVVEVVSASVVGYNFSLGAIFFHTTSPSIDWAANFTNLPTTNGKVITINVIVPQGATPYKITGCSIDGVIQTIRWFGSTVPTGTATKTDVWAFSLIRRTNTWTVLGSVSANFG